MPAFDEIFKAARSLPVPDRIRLIEAIRATLAPHGASAPSAEWVAEAQRRSAEYDAGRMSASPWPDVCERVRRKAGLDA
jgi:putative addiction module component (TIGR02574 family)